MSRIALTPTRPARRRSRSASLTRKLATLSPRPSRGGRARAGASGARAGPPASPDASRRAPSCPRLQMSLISSRISPAMSSSRLPVGSSAIRSGGAFTMARASDARCASPWESWCGVRLGARREPHRLEGGEGQRRDLAARRAEHAEHEGDVVEHRAPGEELGVLEDDADGPAELRNLAAAQASRGRSPRPRSPPRWAARRR